MQITSGKDLGASLWWGRRFHIPPSSRGTFKGESLFASGDRKYVTASFPGGISQSLSEHGKLSPYLGTRTSEISALYNHWEKETFSHLIKNVVSMRRVLNWIVDPTGKLASSIFEMLRCYTGEDWSQGGLEVSRTGSPIHRFKNSRTINGGYTATSPNLLTYAMVTTDT
jgi:hypothetical protein